jgi:hypothetical protein
MSAQAVLDEEFGRDDSESRLYIYQHLTSGVLDTLNVKAFKSLRDGEWVHSGVISAFNNYVLSDEVSRLTRMEACHARDVREVQAYDAKPRVWGYDSLQATGNPRMRFECDALYRARCTYLVLNATHNYLHGVHWMLYVCSPHTSNMRGERTLRVYALDSMLSNGSHHTVRDEDACKFFLTMYNNTTPGWTVQDPVRTVNCPQQTNTDDCGVFAMANIAVLVQVS